MTFSAPYPNTSWALSILAINMVESRRADNGRHSGCALSRTEGEGPEGESLGKGTHSPRGGGRITIKKTKERVARLPSFGALQATWQLGGRQ